MAESLGKKKVNEFLSNGFKGVFKYHLSMGLWLRNTVLFDGSDVYEEFVKHGIDNKDDMSFLYLQLFYCYCAVEFTKS